MYRNVVARSYFASIQLCYVFTFFTPIGFSMPRPLNSLTSISWEKQLVPYLSSIAPFGPHHWHTSKCENLGFRCTYQANKTKPKPLCDH